MSHTRRLVWLALLILALVALDQVTKWAAIQTLRPEPGHRAEVIAFPDGWYPNDLFRFQYATNTGAFLSLGSRLEPGLRFWLLTGLNSVILTIVAVVLVTKRSLKWPVALALSLILTGGIGNLIDRVLNEGVVVDFMNMGIGRGSWSLRTGIFNVADLAIVGGLVLLVALEIFGSRQQQAAVPESEPDAKEG